MEGGCPGPALRYAGEAAAPGRDAPPGVAGIGGTAGDAGGFGLGAAAGPPGAGAGELDGEGSPAPPAEAVVGTAVAAPGGDTGVVVCVVSSVMATTMADHPAPRLGATWEFPERAGRDGRSPGGHPGRVQPTPRFGGHPQAVRTDPRGTVTDDTTMSDLLPPTNGRTPEARLLVVDDEPNIVELLSTSLRFAGFEVATAMTGDDAVRAVERHRPDLVLLDVMLPDVDGFVVLRRLRARQDHLPVLFLTARDANDDKVTGLTLGGDDYVTKPFSLEEVVARIRAVLRRTQSGAEDRPVRLSVADLDLDEDSHQVWRGGDEVQLSPTEFNLLRYLMINTGRVLSKAQILDHVWSYDFDGDANIVESYISYLRRKLDAGREPLIHTVRGVGYVLRPPRARD